MTDLDRVIALRSAIRLLSDAVIAAHGPFSDKHDRRNLDTRLREALEVIETTRPKFDKGNAP